MKGILDDTKLQGVVEVSTALRPHRRIAELLPAGDLTTFGALLDSDPLAPSQRSVVM